MRQRVRFLFLVFGLVVMLGLAPSATAGVIHVHPGHSIQAAIDSASPGDVIVVARGTYRENLTITTDHLTLRGAAGKAAPLLKPASVPTESVCVDPEAPDEVDGICVFGEFDPVTGEFGAPVVGTTIKGFRIDGFSGFGILLLNAKRSTVTHTVASNNGSYGISGFVLSGVRFQHNVAHHNAEPGFYIGDSPHAKAVVRDNRAYKNVGPEGFGFLFRDSSMGVVRNNRAWGNCVGMVFVDTGENPDPLSRWTVKNNVLAHNNASCEGEEEGAPPTSGVGIAVLGGDRVVLSHNRVFGNRPSGPSAFQGGIAIASAVPLGGADPTHNLVVKNHAFGNAPVDVFYDGSGSGNVFRRNHCGSSSPPWICG